MKNAYLSDNIYTLGQYEIYLHNCTFNPPPSRAVMSERGDSECAFQMCNCVKNKLVSFYFHLTRKSSGGENIALSSQYNDFVKVLHKNLNEKGREKYAEISQKYLGYICALTAQTRDIIRGKGEHDLTYMMIWNLYLYFPKQAIHLINCLVKPPSTNELPYGSWRDIKYLCQYIRENSPLAQDDPLITLCIHIANQQLKDDLHSWKFSKNAFSRNHISNVAKWIPREYKKFDWLYEKMAIHWTLQEFPILLKTPFSVDTPRFMISYNKALCKAKRLYRKSISLLNKGLDTTEIRLCANSTRNIIPKNVSKTTTMKQPCLIYTKDCSGNFQKYLTQKYDPDGATENASHRDDKSSQSHSQLPFSYFIERGVCLLREQEEEVIENSGRCNFETELLNSQWKELMRTLPRKMNRVLPIIDISFPMQCPNKESYYTAVGMAMAIAEKTTFGKRILALDNQPIWINLENTDNFMAMITVFYVETRSHQNTYCNFLAGIDMVISALKNAKMPPNHTDDIELVIFSNFYGNTPKMDVDDTYSTQEWCKQPVSALYAQIKAAFLRQFRIDAPKLHGDEIDEKWYEVTGGFSYPRVVFWNLDNGGFPHFPNENGDNEVENGEAGEVSCDDPRVRFFSGFSPALLGVLCTTKRMSAFDSICHILNHKRYAPVRNIGDLLHIS